MRIIQTTCLLSLLWSTISVAGPAPPQHIGIDTPQAELLRALDASEFILTGTIIEPGGSNVTSLRPSPETAIMRVTSLIESSPDQRIVNPTDDVTLIFPQSLALKADMQILVFARTFIVGERVALSVVQSSDPNESDGIPTLTARIPQLIRSRAANELRHRLLSAEAVVLGRTTRRFDAADELDVLSEHHPQLRAVIISVDEQLLGTPVPSPLIVRYATARDKSWKGAPSLEPDPTSRIFVLRLVKPYSTERFVMGGSVTRVYTLLDQADLLPTSTLETVRDIAASQPP